MHRQSHKRETVISVARLDLVNVRKAGRGLERGVKLEFPPEGHGIPVKALQIVGRRTIRLDLRPLPVEGHAAVVVRSGVNMKEENRLPHVNVEDLGDVGAEVRVTAIRRVTVQVPPISTIFGLREAAAREGPTGNQQLSAALDGLLHQKLPPGRGYLNCYFDFILDAVSAEHDINAYLNLLDLNGNMTLV